MDQFRDDITLLAAFQNGDSAGEKAVFERYFQPLCLFSERITSDLPLSEDIVADSFIKLIDRRMDFPSIPQLKSFLYTTVQNASINHAVSRRRHQVIHENIRYLATQDSTAEDQLEAEILRAELIREIYQEIENLPDKCGQIFKMIFLEQLSTEDIASRLSINVQTVRSQKARALQLIRTSLLKKNRFTTLLLLTALASL